MTCYLGSGKPIIGLLFLTGTEEATLIDGTGELSKLVGEIVKGNCDILSRGHKIIWRWESDVKHRPQLS